MFVPVTLYLFAAAVCCGVNGWETEHLYKYDLQSCFSYVKDGVINNGFYKSDLYIQPISNDKLSVTIQNVRKIRTAGAKDPEKCEAFPSDELNFKNKTFSGEPFEINMKKGVVTSLTVNPNAKDGELALIKTTSSLIQLDLQGENCKDPKSCQLPTESNLKAVYQTMENSTRGLCETQYEVSPLESSLQRKSNEKGQSFKVIKTTDYKKCPRGSTNVSYKNTNSVVVSGNLEQYMIQSADLKFKAEWSPEVVHLPQSTIALVMSLKLTSTYPAEGPAHSISNPQEDSLKYKWVV